MNSLDSTITINLEIENLADVNCDKSNSCQKEYEITTLGIFFQLLIFLAKNDGDQIGKDSTFVLYIFH